MLPLAFSRIPPMSEQPRHGSVPVLDIGAPTQTSMDSVCPKADCVSIVLPQRPQSTIFRRR
jgi:hypothetical protein